MTRAAVLIDGGHLRVLSRQAHKTVPDFSYIPDFIEKFAHACITADEQLWRVLYYDCAPFDGDVRAPVSGKTTKFKGSDAWLRELASRDHLAVRRGVPKFRGFKPRKIPITGKELADEDFKPDFEQKGVDMRIGLDIAAYSANRAAERIVLVTGDTDCVPAMKHALKAGLQVILVELPNGKLAPELTWHCDIRRSVRWPE